MKNNNKNIKKQFRKRVSLLRLYHITFTLPIFSIRLGKHLPYKEVWGCCSTNNCTCEV